MPQPMNNAAVSALTGEPFTISTTMPAFIYKRRIAFHETDAAGVVYFANYFHLAEEAETHAIASLGCIVTRDSYLYPRVHVEADYHAPLRFFDEVAVHCNVSRIGSSSMYWEFKILHNEQICATIKSVSSRRKPDGSPAPYDEAERAAYQALQL